MTSILTVTFAVPSREGVVCTQRVRSCHINAMHHPQDALVRARKAATRKGVKVGNWLTITHKGVLIADYVKDTAARFR